MIQFESTLDRLYHAAVLACRAPRSASSTLHFHFSSLHLLNKQPLSRLILLSTKLDYFTRARDAFVAMDGKYPRLNA